jgi:Protein of unknown function (DUF1524)
MDLRCVRDVALKTRASKQEKAAEIYYAFREFFRATTEKDDGLEEAIAEMLRYARYYAGFSLGRGVTGERAQALAKLRHLVDVPAVLIMRLFECRESLGSLKENEFLDALALIESYVLRRAICGYQTRDYWQIFASIAYNIGDKDPLTDLKVTLARQRENYRFPSNEEFGRALKEGDLYGLRVCRHLLEGLENYRSNEPTDTSGYSIEHIMPQDDRLRPEWRKMLGETWKDVKRPGCTGSGTLHSRDTTARTLTGRLRKKDH